MGSSFRMSGDFERQLNKAVRGALEDVAADHQKMLDRLGRQYRGRPVAEIKPVLKREWSKDGGSISDPELSDYAQLISDGTRIKVEVE